MTSVHPHLITTVVEAVLGSGPMTCKVTVSDALPWPAALDRVGHVHGMLPGDDRLVQRLGWLPTWRNTH